MFAILMKFMLNTYRKIAQGDMCCIALCGPHSGWCECQDNCRSKFIGTI